MKPDDVTGAICFLLFLIGLFVCIFGGLEQARQNQIERERPRNARSAARWELVRYYQSKFDILQHVFPLPLLRAFCVAHTAESLPPDAVCAACMDLIARLQPLVVREKERRQGKDEAQSSVPAPSASEIMDSILSMMGHFTTSVGEQITAKLREPGSIPHQEMDS